MVRVEGADLTAIDADAQCVDVLEKLTDVAGSSRSEVVVWLKTHTVADVPAAARNRINTRLQNVGIDTSGITLATTLYQVIELVFRQHVPSGSLDDM